MANITIKPQDIIGECIALDIARRKCETLDNAEIQKKVAEVFPPEKLDEIKADTTSALNDLFATWNL